MRHGESEANARRLIVSAPQNGTEKFGITDAGRMQVHQSVRSWQDKMSGVQQIFTSDFLRARQTAEIAGQLLDRPVEMDIRLRERDFGTLELKSNSNYALVWELDARETDARETEAETAGNPWQAESVDAVLRRTAAAIRDLMANAHGDLLIVSHGDPLQILLAGLEGRSPHEHRQLPPFQVAEIRQPGVSNLVSALGTENPDNR